MHKRNAATSQTAMSEVQPSRKKGLSTRERILRKTSELFEDRGFHGTGLNEIVRKSRAPKGSIYYHFPGGKEEIASEAVLFAGRTLAGRIRKNMVKKGDATTTIRTFVSRMSFFVEASGYRSGGPLTIVASEIATTNKRVNHSCREAYKMIKEAFIEKLRSFGFSERDADALSIGIVAAIEGGIIMSRTYHSRKPLLSVARLLEQALRG